MGSAAVELFAFGNMRSLSQVEFRVFFTYDDETTDTCNPTMGY